MSQAVIEQLIDPVSQCFTPDVARQIAALRATPLVQNRIDELAEKCNEGTLSSEEREDYESIVRALNFIGLLQAKARAAVAASGG